MYGCVGVLEDEIHPHSSLGSHPLFRLLALFLVLLSCPFLISSFVAVREHL